MNTKLNRRKFLAGSSTVVAGSLLPKVVFANNLPEGVSLLSPEKWISADDLPKDFHILNKIPVNAYPPVHSLAPAITPAEVMFVRCNGKNPEVADINPDEWTLTIKGESSNAEQTFTLKELKEKFEHHTYQLVLECGGNGRGNFYPKGKGNQWGDTAVACPEWTGVRLKDVLNAVGYKDDAVYIGYYSADTHLKGKGDAISRGIPFDAALDDHTLLAWEMNGKPLPILHGYPLRLIAGGRPGSVSGKWINAISVRNIVHDGKKMGAPSYQVPNRPVAPGEKVEKPDYQIIEGMVVKSLITSPQSGTLLKDTDSVKVSGHAWAGLEKVEKVEVSVDFGKTWKMCNLTQPANKYAWQQFDAEVSFPEKGYYEIWARATDSKGNTQPMLQSNWNPKGYLFNASHRVAVRTA